MNIFALDTDPALAAQYHCDKHVVKMLLETSQILCSVFWQHNIEAPYKLSHENHPSNKWARESKGNFTWLLGLGAALCWEYFRRYGKIHKSQAVIQWVSNNCSKLQFLKEEITEFAVAISEEANCRQIEGFDSQSVINKYRLYYQFDKSHFCTWKNGRPEWF